MIPEDDNLLDKLTDKQKDNLETYVEDLFSKLTPEHIEKANSICAAGKTPRIRLDKDGVITISEDFDA